MLRYPYFCWRIFLYFTGMGYGAIQAYLHIYFIIGLRAPKYLNIFCHARR